MDGILAVIGVAGVIWTISGWQVPERIRWPLTFLAFLLLFGGVLNGLYREWTALAPTYDGIVAFINSAPIRSLLWQAVVFLFAVAVALFLMVRPVVRRLDKIDRLLDQFVRPRRLLPKQIKAISRFLRKNPPKEIVIDFATSKGECSQFMSDFHQAISNGGWRILEANERADLPEGVSIHSDLPPGYNPTAIKDDPERLLRAAFKAARLPFDNGSSAGGSAIKEYKLTLRIGERPTGMFEEDARTQLEKVRAQIDAELKKPDPMLRPSVQGWLKRFRNADD